jgi:hypothetical protein
VHDVYGIPVAVLIGVGAGMLAGGAIYAFYPKPELREKLAGLVGVGAGLLVAGLAAVLLPKM